MQAVSLKTDRRTRRTSVDGTIGNTIVELRARRPWASKQWGVTGAVGEDDIEATLRHRRRMSRDGTIAGTWGRHRIALELKMEDLSNASVTGNIGELAVHITIRQRVKGKVSVWAEPNAKLELKVCADEIVGEIGCVSEVVGFVLALPGLPVGTAETPPWEQMDGFPKFA